MSKSERSFALCFPDPSGWAVACGLLLGCCWAGGLSKGIKLGLAHDGSRVTKGFADGTLVSGSHGVVVITADFTPAAVVIPTDSCLLARRVVLAGVAPGSQQLGESSRGGAERYRD